MQVTFSWWIPYPAHSKLRWAHSVPLNPPTDTGQIKITIFPENFAQLSKILIIICHSEHCFSVSKICSGGGDPPHCPHTKLVLFYSDRRIFRTLRWRKLFLFISEGHLCFLHKMLSAEPSLPEDEGNNNQSDNILNILLLMGAENFKLYPQGDCEMWLAKWLAIFLAPCRFKTLPTTRNRSWSTPQQLARLRPAPAPPPGHHIV